MLCYFSIDHFVFLSFSINNNTTHYYFILSRNLVYTFFMLRCTNYIKIQNLPYELSKWRPFEIVNVSLKPLASAKCTHSSFKKCIR